MLLFVRRHAKYCACTDLLILIIGREHDMLGVGKAQKGLCYLMSPLPRPELRLSASFCEEEESRGKAQLVYTPIVAFFCELCVYCR